MRIVAIIVGLVLCAGAALWYFWPAAHKQDVAPVVGVAEQHVDIAALATPGGTGGPEVWAKLYPVPKREPLTASG